ncbi:patatin-like phospholipase family protein [Thermophilibacter sp.]
MRTGVIDVGGGLRGIYAAGVFDRCMDEGVRFDVGIGVSAGSANLTSYAAGQRGRNYRFYTDYAFRPEYLSVANLLRGTARHSVVGLDYVYGTLSNSDGEDPVDYPALRDSSMELYVVATDAETGAPVYFDKSDMAQDDYDILKASSALPLACRPYPVRGRECFDGALGDPVPVAKALELGCERIVVVLTKPERVRRTPERDEKIARLIRHRHPRAAEALCDRARRYNEGVEFAERLAREGRVLIVSPDDTCGVDTLTRDHDALDRLYHKGYDDGAAISVFLAA